MRTSDSKKVPTELQNEKTQHKNVQDACSASDRLVGIGFLIFLLAVVVLLGGCSQAVTVETDFPKPVIAPLPLKAGLRYDDSLTGYQYAEELPQDGSWSFSLGNANRRLFDTVFGSLFRETVAVSAIDEAGQEHPDIDVIIEPSVEAMELALGSA